MPQSLGREPDIFNAGALPVSPRMARPCCGKRSGTLTLVLRAT
jgi:hypothetical protein